MSTLVTIWSHFCIKKFADDIGGILIVLGRHMLVDPHCHGHISMTEALRNDLHRNPRSKHERRCSMSSVMQIDRRYASPPPGTDTTVLGDLVL
jgi:hypothetical protein